MASDDDGKLIFWATVGFGAGIYWFFKGFKIYREYRVIEDTPEIPIRSMAMGLVQIHGKARLAAGNLINSPVSGTPCLFYRVDIEKYQRDSKGNGSWSHYKTDCNGLPFYLDDGTGKALVNPFGAEYDLVQSARREAGGLGSLGGSGSFAGLRAFRSFQSNRPGFGRLLSGMDGPETAAASPAAGVPVATAAPDSPAAQAALQTVPRFVSESDLVAYALSTHSVATSGTGLHLGGVSLSGLSIGGGSAGRFRFTEFCVLPEHWYDVTGTCTENPSPKDESDRNMIMKGQNEPTFLISWRNEKGVEGMLRRQAFKYVFGGAGLSVVCLAVLLAKFGWLF
ncbi:MAG TPA: hypothetical protein VFM21_10750 [Terriglobia bacterium]|nr:hypothetical protein [Terriglobia bacterium]